MLLKVIISWRIPQIFFPFKKMSLGNFKVIFSLIQYLIITSEIITGFIIENSANGGKFFLSGKNNDANKFPLSEIHSVPWVPLPLVWVSA